MFLLASCLMSNLIFSQANEGLELPNGFQAVKFADSVGRARHIAVSNDGKVFVKLNKTINNAGIICLEDSDKDGLADKQKSFGNYIGTGIFIKNNYLYASSNSAIFRYKLDVNNNVLDTVPEVIVKGLIARKKHESKAFTLDNAGNIFVDIGAYSNSCQVEDRQKGSLGIPNCPLLDSAAGIWKFDANKTNQTYADGSRYAKGFRHIVGLDWNTADNSLYVMQHGRDQLNMFPEYFSPEMSANLPAETFYKITDGANGAWPFCYYDPYKKAYMQSPEYGGDGKKLGCSDATLPIMDFPAHMAPVGLLFYTGNMFPEHYKDGAFIAFHGSWNRSPSVQEGYMVAFVPFKNGKPSGDYEVFANNFAGVKVVETTKMAKHRPVGLAQGPEGELYVSDDVGGTIYKIIYKK